MHIYTETEHLLARTDAMFSLAVIDHKLIDTCMHAHTHHLYTPSHTHAGTSPFVLTGLASGNHIFVVTPLQISDPSLPQCGSGKRGLIRQLIVIRL